MRTDAVVDGLWALADDSIRHRNYTAAIKSLECVIQSNLSLLPLTEIRTRLRLASLLLNHTHNVTHAKTHLERAHLLLSPIPSSLPLKLTAASLLSRCYHILGSIASQKAIILKALALLRSHDAGVLDARKAMMWSANFQAQMANALAIEEDYDGALEAIGKGAEAAEGAGDKELGMFFAGLGLQVQLLAWEESAAVEAAVVRCKDAWERIDNSKRIQCPGLFFYHELLQTFYLLRICDYKSASQHVEKLDAAKKIHLQKAEHIKKLKSELDAVSQSLSESNVPRKERSALLEKQEKLQENLRENEMPVYEDKLYMAPPPLDGEWLPKGAVFTLVDLMAVVVGRPKGLFKECARQIESGVKLIHEELFKLGIHDEVREVDLKKHSTAWMAGLYLTILMQFLENKIALELTRSDFVEAQQALVQMKNWFIRFPSILDGCECNIEMLRGQYAHSVGAFREAAYHFIEATKLTKSKSMQAMCQVYAALSSICLGDAESTTQALNLVGPIYRVMDSFVGVREKACIVFVHGLLLMRQHNPQDARVRLASGLKIAYQQLGNIQLVSQYLTVLGTLALQLHDTTQAKEILKSSLTLAKTLYDVPTQIWVLSIYTALYRELGELENEMENSEYERKKENDLQRRLSESHSRSHHLELIERSKIEVPLHKLQRKRAIAGPSTNDDLDIPESVGLPTPPPASSLLPRLRDPDSGKRAKRKI